MPVVDNIIGIVRGINDRKKSARVDDVLSGGGDPSKNYLNDARGAAQGVMDIDPRLAIQMSGVLDAKDTAAADRKRKMAGENTATMAKYFRSIDPAGDVGGAIDNVGTYLTEAFGIEPGNIAAFKQAAMANPELLAGIDDDAFEAMAKDRFNDTIATPGSIVRRGGKTVEKVPYGSRVVNTPAGTLSRVFNPNTGQYEDEEGSAPQLSPSGSAPTPGNPSAPLSLETLRPHFVKQESSGDYTAKNKETGALGRYQIMPETGQALAKRLGLPWRPDMMTQDTPSARRYQDAFGDAAIQEAIDYGKGDLDETTGYYYAGPDKKGWGPKTRQYQEDMRGRLGGSNLAEQPAEAVMGRTSTYNPPAPKTATPKPQANILSPAEAVELGFDKGTIVQRDENGNFKVLQKPSATAAKMDQKTIDNGKQMVDSFEGLMQKAQFLLQNKKGMDEATGFIAGRLPALALGQDAQNFVNDLENLKQNIGLSALASFKAMSAAGASGFGNLSNAEGERLNSLFGTLERTSDVATIRRTLATIMDIAQDKVSNGRKTLKSLEGGGSGGRPTATNAKGDKVVWNGKAWEPMK
jgi:hypothetical protein